MKFRLFILINFIPIFFFLSCNKDISRSSNDKETIRRIVILYTNDEHGWLEESETTDGAAKLMGIWRNVEKYTEDSLFLILSGGDMWTGPAISTWFKGQSMAEVMNAMNYRAAAIGNHEFDFKIEGLKERIVQSNFPFLSANIREKETGEIADIAIPYIIKEINGVKVGIIGLTTVSTCYSAFPDYVKNFNFIPYDEALEEIVPQVKENGAELLIVIGHICSYDMEKLAPTAAKLGITLIGGGHCHELINEKINGVSIIEAGSYMRNYAKVEILFDSIADTVVSIKQELHKNQGGTPDPEIQSIVTYWQNQA
ncbi:MAG: metallophosphatase, partial [Candidatus Marinimicrobia bacterium]|nr:metallophosphatase [Candidatus Neomarinimicrobiota bacterium]